MNKLTLYDRGQMLVYAFCVQNELTIPEFIRVPSSEWQFNVCAYYRPTYIRICLEKCAAIGVAGMAWSYPGYIVDRTPYGVLAHELGHHVDVSCSKSVRGGYMGDFSTVMRQGTGEGKLTNYCPNDAEWFAEIFRLYVTNPDLLRLVRPKMYTELHQRFTPVVTEPWDTVLQHAPARTIAAAERKANGCA